MIFYFELVNISYNITLAMFHYELVSVFILYPIGYTIN
jgi:hypothetical protein